VLLTYDSDDAGDRAMELLEYLVATLGKEFLFFAKLWRIDLMQLAQHREQARTDAAATDLMVVAHGVRGRLPPHFAEWLEGWAKHRSGDDVVVLAALPVGPAAQGIAAAAVTGMPRRLAERHGLTFLYFDEAGPGEQWQTALGHVRRQARPFAPTLSELIDAPSHSSR
jgi:hypothetical protein